jgi:hypothetical protein
MYCDRSILRLCNNNGHNNYGFSPFGRGGEKNPKKKKKPHMIENIATYESLFTHFAYHEVSDGIDYYYYYFWVHGLDLKKTTGRSGIYKAEFPSRLLGLGVLFFNRPIWFVFMGDPPISSQINYTSSSDFSKCFVALSERASERALCCAMPLGRGIPKINGPSSISGQALGHYPTFPKKKPYIF